MTFPLSAQLRSRLRAFLLTSALLISLTACSSDHGTTTGAGGSATGPAGASTTDPLGKLLVATAPDGFVLRPDRAAHTGSTDLVKAVQDDGRPDARSALTAEHFEHGYQRLWTNGHGEIVAVQIYRFATRAGASASFRRAVSVAARQAQRVARFPIAGVPAPQVNAVEVDVEGNRTDQVVAVSGRLVLQLVCTSRTDTALRARAAALTVAQFRRLP